MVNQYVMNVLKEGTVNYYLFISLTLILTLNHFSYKRRFSAAPGAQSCFGCAAGSFNNRTGIEFVLFVVYIPICIIC